MMQTRGSLRSPLRSSSSAQGGEQLLDHSGADGISRNDVRHKNYPLQGDDGRKLASSLERAEERWDGVNFEAALKSGDFQELRRAVADLQNQNGNLCRKLRTYETAISGREGSTLDGLIARELGIDDVNDPTRGTLGKIETDDPRNAPSLLNENLRLQDEIAKLHRKIREDREKHEKMRTQVLDRWKKISRCLFEQHLCSFFELLFGPLPLTNCPDPQIVRQQKLLRVHLDALLLEFSTEGLRFSKGRRESRPHSPRFSVNHRSDG
jgi:hypothetical protein